MMPIIMAETGREYGIVKIGGNDAARAHLQNLGFVPGAKVTLVSCTGGNAIVNVKNVRVALGMQLAQKIFI